MQPFFFDELEKIGYELRGHTTFQGLRIAVENRKGDVRRGTDGDGKKWETRMRVPYGYIKGTKGKDGEGVDCYVGPNKEAPAAFVVHQHKPDGTGYDEDKVMLGFPSKKAAKEAFLMHYDSPKFLGPMAKVSMDRLRELVASKKKLVKISSVQGKALLEELMAIEKTAFNLADARKVLQLAKRQTLKVPRVRQAGKRLQRAIQSGATESPPGMSVAEAMLAGGGGGAPMAVSRGAHRQIQAMTRSGAVSGGAATPQVLASTKQLGGKILTAKGGDATTAIRRHPLVSPVVSGSIGRMTPQQRIMHNAAVTRHEMAELAIKSKPAPTAFGLATGHRGAEAPLTDSTILATLPKGSEAVKDTVRAYRPIESHFLERATRGVGGRPGMEFGSQRLSRHARKRVAGRMEELATGDFKEALADPERGPLIRAQLKAQGVGILQDVGKLASVVGAPQRPQKKAAKEAFLMHYDSPKFLGPMAKVSMERLRELVASKKQLTKISAVQGQALLQELMLLQKTAFNLRDARTVLRIAKKKTLKVPRIRQASKKIRKAMRAGEDEVPGMTMAEGMLAGGGGTPMAVGKGAHKQLSRMVQAGALTGPMTSPEVLASTKRLSGRILKAKGGDTTAAIRRHPALPKAVTEPLSRLTPQQRIMHNAIIMRHEMAEQAIKGADKPTAFGIMTGHRGPSAPLSDSTILATLPKGSQPITESVRGYRPVESQLLERATRGVGGRPGVEFGGQRLSRHARKRVSKRMEELATGDLQEALSHAETGPMVRAGLRGQGIQDIQGIGKLASAVGAPESVRKRERGRLVRKAGPGIGGLLGAGIGALVGARRGKLLRGAVTGLGTGATLGWTPDMYHSAKQAIKRYRRKVK